MRPYSGYQNVLYPGPMDAVGEKFTGQERDAETGLDYFESYPSGRYLVICLAELFDIIDPRASELWECRVPDSGGIPIWPASWFKHEFYHDRLSEGEPELEADFTRLKALFADEAQRRASAAEPIK
jgi:hypothetical protein